METTVVPAPTFDLDYFVGMVRKHARGWSDLGALGLEYVRVFTSDGDPAEQLERIRNILAAVDLVRAEQAESQR
jgi:hypothetical protein